MKNLTSIGNLKIGKDTIIFNMSSAKNCPSDKLGLCKLSKICYAKKAERQYKNVLPFRERQTNYWLNNTADKISFDLIKYLANKKGIKYLRFNEAGDFHSQECINKAESIARQLKQSLNINSYTYTSRPDLSFAGCYYLTVNCSGFYPSNLDLHNSINTFTAVDKDYKPTKLDKVCGMDCRQCNHCKKGQHKKIVVLKH